jgi:hypothetical protein
VATPTSECESCHGYDSSPSDAPEYWTKGGQPWVPDSATSFLSETSNTQTKIPGPKSTSESHDGESYGGYGYDGESYSDYDHGKGEKSITTASTATSSSATTTKVTKSSDTKSLVPKPTGVLGNGRETSMSSAPAPATTLGPKDVYASSRDRVREDGSYEYGNDGVDTQGASPSGGDDGSCKVQVVTKTVWA